MEKYPGGYIYQHCFCIFGEVPYIILLCDSNSNVHVTIRGHILKMWSSLIYIAGPCINPWVCQLKIHLAYFVKFRFQEQIFIVMISDIFSYLSDFSICNFECQPNHILSMLPNFLMRRKWFLLVGREEKVVCTFCYLYMVKYTLKYFWTAVAVKAVRGGYQLLLARMVLHWSDSLSFKEECGKRNRKELSGTGNAVIHLWLPGLWTTKLTQRVCEWCKCRNYCCPK